MQAQPAPDGQGQTCRRREKCFVGQSSEGSDAPLKLGCNALKESPIRQASLCRPWVFPVEPTRLRASPGTPTSVVIYIEMRPPIAGPLSCTEENAREIRAPGVIVQARKWRMHSESDKAPAKGNRRIGQPGNGFVLATASCCHDDHWV